MRKSTAVLVLCALLLLADFFWLKLTIGVEEALTFIRFSSVLVAQVATAFAIILLGYLVIRKSLFAAEKAG